MQREPTATQFAHEWHAAEMNSKNEYVSELNIQWRLLLLFALGYVTHTQDEYNVRLKRPSGALIKALIRVQSLEKSNIHCAYR